MVKSLWLGRNVGQLYVNHFRVLAESVGIVHLYQSRVLHGVL